MINEFIRDLMCFVFSLAHVFTRPLKWLGLCGLEDSPVFYDKGDNIPFFILMKYPFSLDMTFGCDVETFYKEGKQWVCAQGEFSYFINLGDFVVCGLIGSPTHWNAIPRIKHTNLKSCLLYSSD